LHEDRKSFQYIKAGDYLTRVNWPLDDLKWSNIPIPIQQGVPRVMCDLKIENVKNVDLSKGEAFVKCVVSLSWYDSRLKFYQPNKALPGKLWTPVVVLAEATNDCKMNRIEFGLVPGSIDGQLFTKTVYEGTISLKNSDEEIAWYPYDHHNIMLTLIANM